MPLDPVGRFWRAVHETGGGALVDGTSALRAAGLTGLDDDVVHVSVHMLARAPDVTGVRVHKVSRRLVSETVPAGLPRTRPPVAALRAAQWAVTDRQAALVLAMPVQQRLVTGEQLQAARAEYVGRRRRALVATLIDDIADGAHSLGELDFEALCRRRGLPVPERQVVVSGPGGRCYLDVRWREGLMVLRIPLIGLRLEPKAFSLTRSAGEGRGPPASAGGEHRRADEAFAGGPPRRGPRGHVGLAATQAGEDRDERGDLLGRGVAKDLDALPGRHGALGRGDILVGAHRAEPISALSLRSGHSGMFPCFLGGSVSRLDFRARSALLMFIRELLGVITVSMYPRSAAT